MKAYSGSTYVTGLWNIGRDERDFNNHYLKHFEQLLSVNIALVIYADPSLKDWVFRRRSRVNTEFHGVPLEDFKHAIPIGWSLIEKIRTSEVWLQQADWLRNSPQATLEYYNPIVFSKVHWLSQTAASNPFNSSRFYWIDAGITNTVQTNILHEALPLVDYNKFTFLNYPHTVDTEIHGFDREHMSEYCGVDFVDKVSRGGFFGGEAFYLDVLHGVYYSYLYQTLEQGLMGTEESLFTIMSYQRPDIIDGYDLPNGLIQPYFENTIELNKKGDVIVYIQTYNTPKQVLCLLESMANYDADFLFKSRLVLLDNSDDPDVEDEYQEIIAKNPFIERIKRDNPGITGGRMLAAEHFHQTNADFYFFFEDDMLLHNADELDSLGFQRNVKNLFKKVVAIAKKEKFDFIKLSFQEIFAVNSTNTTWHNVDEKFRNDAWPDDQNTLPTVKYDAIKAIDGLAYANGDVFYANWPHIMSREGNRKIFIDSDLDQPSEASLMKSCYQLWMQGNLNPAILLASPIRHYRSYDYDRSKRKES